MAGINKTKHQYFAFSVIILGTLVSFMQVLDAALWVRILTAFLGASVTIIQAVNTLLHPGETWQTYRKASENMKREYRLYVSKADVYADTANEEAAYLLLVQRVESVIAEEQKLFWQFQDKKPHTQQTQEPS